MKITRYWDLFTPREWAPPLSADAAATSVRQMLDRSVDARLMSDVPVGVLLSGGVDSTTIVALLRERLPGVATFSVGFKDQPHLDERQEAKRVADHFGTNHHEITLSEHDAVNFLEQLVHHQDEPLGDPVCLPLNFVCQLARNNGVKVVLAGEGADELFWGYPSYLRALARWPFIRAALKLPTPLRSALPRSFPARLSPMRHELLEGVASSRPLPAHVPLGIARFYRDRLLTPTATSRHAWAPSDGGAEDGPRHGLDRLAFDTQEYEFGLRLPELLLMRIDRFSMANSVEARLPFLDPDLVEHVYRMPLEQKISGGVTKMVLRNAISDIVPSWVLDRRKQGFGAPVASWMTTRLGSVFRGLLQEDEALRRYFDVELLEAELDRLPSKGARFSLWPVMNFAIWHRYWIEGKPLEPKALTSSSR